MPVLLRAVAAIFAAGAATTASLAVAPGSWARPVGQGAAGAGVTMAAGRRCPRDLATRLRGTGGAAQLMTVEAAGFGTPVATVELWQRQRGCWARVAGPWPSLIGVNGFSDHHREGDDTTPTGIYRFGRTVYGTNPNPGYRGPYHRLVCGDWWDEDPTSPQYNTFQHIPCGQDPPFGGESEPLWTETAYYPSLAVVEYNVDPVIAYAGSAIFVHASTGAPTTGCVSIPIGDLDEFLRWLDPSLYPAIAMAPAAELSRF